MAKLPRLQRTTPVVNKMGLPSLQFHKDQDKFAKAIEDQLALIQAQVTDIAAALAAATAAQATATAAASDAATATADAAAAAADAASAAATATIGNSGTIGAFLQGFDDTISAAISIPTHTRVYGDGTSVSVTADTIFGLAFSTTYYVYYDDPTRAGGGVTYNATTSQTTAAQTGDRHLVGQVDTPASGGATIDGFYVGAPGVGLIYQ